MTSYRTILAVAALLFASFAADHARAQDAPVISGGAGFFSTTTAGATFVQPVFAPVGLLPVGQHMLIEARGDLREVVARQFGTTGPWQGQFFGTLEYLQVDVNASPYLTITAGRFLTPFGIYNERFTPIWIRNLPEAPLIFAVGTRTTGSSDGAMVRGAVPLKPGTAEWNYSAYFSAGSTVDQFVAARSAGFRSGLFFPRARLEVGASYERFREDEHFNTSGAYLSWEPRLVPVDLRGEYAHAPSGHGYWIEAAYHVSTAATWLHRFQPVARWQQFWRLSPRPGDALPAGDAQQVDLGVNYFLRPDLRITSSYGRRFGEVAARNTWNVGLTYRLLIPVARGGSK